MRYADPRCFSTKVDSVYNCVRQFLCNGFGELQNDGYYPMAWYNEKGKIEFCQSMTEEYRDEIIKEMNSYHGDMAEQSAHEQLLKDHNI